MRVIARVLRAAPLLLVACTGLAAVADEPAVTVLTGFEDDSVAARVAGVRNILPTDCKLAPTSIPARTGQRSMKIAVGATAPGARVDCDLHFRSATPFHQADRVAAYVCIYQNTADLLFRVRDATGQLYETRPARTDRHGQFIRVTASLTDSALQPIETPGQPPVGDPQWPITIDGFSVHLPSAGRQDVYVDDIEVEHHVPLPELVRGEFVLDQPTHLYEPGSRVKAALRLENLSRRDAFRVSVRLAWLASGGHELAASENVVTLPRSSADFRSFQDVSFDREFDEPGLYRIVASVREARWPVPADFQTTIAVLPSNRTLPRGRATFFGVRSNTLREARADHEYEVELARWLGVQLFALETPWARIEPAADQFDFAELGPVVETIAGRDIGLCLSLVEPPEWLPPDADGQIERQARLLEALARQFGGKVDFYQAAPLPGSPLNPGELAKALSQRLASAGAGAAGARAVILAPPLNVQDEPSAASAPPASGRWVLSTSGDPAAAARELRTFGQRRNVSWGENLFWQHTAPPRQGAGHLADAVHVLKTYVEAARLGLGGVLWCDLRDDSADPRFVQEMRGLVGRDFSPKVRLVGYASSVGMLYGLRYVGPLLGAPDAFDSALFIGAERQVAVLFPKPGAPLPVVLAPIATAEGELKAFDFERRELPVIESAGPLLVPTIDRPMFIALTATRALKDPVLSLAATPWLRAPRTVLCAGETDLEIGLTAPFSLSRNRSRIQLLIPPDAGMESSLASRRIAAEPGETLTFDVKLTCQPGAARATTATLRLVLERQRIEIPIHLLPLSPVRPTASSEDVCRSEFAAGRLALDTPPTGGASDPPLSLLAGYDAGTLRLAIPRPERITAGAKLRIGLVGEADGEALEVEITDPWSEPQIAPLFGTAAARVADWKASAVREAKQPICVVEIPAGVLGFETLTPGQTLRMAVRIIEPASIFAGREWSVGGGLSGNRSPADYAWFGLVE